MASAGGRSRPRVGAILLLVAFVASWVPAWCASRLDPLLALR